MWRLNVQSNCPSAIRRKKSLLFLFVLALLAVQAADAEEEDPNAPLVASPYRAASVQRMPTRTHIGLPGGDAVAGRGARVPQRQKDHSCSGHKGIPLRPRYAMPGPDIACCEALRSAARGTIAPARACAVRCARVTQPVVRAGLH
eukprot:1118484-Rhodomonas_salina.1